MQYKKILVPIDGSEQSLRALKVAVDLAKESQDTQICGIRIIPAMDMPTNTELGADPFSPVPYVDMIDPVAFNELRDASVARAKHELEELTADVVKDMEGRVALDVVMSGSASAGIIEYAEENDCDFIVMGSRGLGRIRSILGSVSYSVLQSSDVPVTIVK